MLVAYVVILLIIKIQNISKADVCPVFWSFRLLLCRSITLSAAQFAIAGVFNLVYNSMFVVVVVGC